MLPKNPPSGTLLCPPATSSMYAKWSGPQKKRQGLNFTQVTAPTLGVSYSSNFVNHLS